MRIKIDQSVQDRQINLHTAPKGWYQYNDVVIFYKPNLSQYIEFHQENGTILHSACGSGSFSVRPFVGAVTLTAP